MTKYDKLPDSILLELVASGDVDAQEYMLLKYKPLVISEIRFLYLVGAETEDLAQEGMIGLFTAIRDYKKDMKASFHTFATTCVRNRIHAVRQTGRSIFLSIVPSPFTIMKMKMKTA